jgi:MFS family permease
MDDAPIQDQPKKPVLRRMLDFFGLKRSIVGLLGMVILVGMGEHMGEKFLPLYMVALGGAILSVGFLSGMDNLLGALYSFPGGYLADRLGTKRSLIIFNLTAMIGYAIVILIPSWVAVLVGAFFFLSWSAISLPATMGLVAKALPKDKRTMGVSMHSLIRRIPKALGPLLGGIFVDAWGVQTGVRLAFAVALAMALIALVIQQIMMKADKPKGAGASDSAERNPLRMWRRMSGSLRNLLVSDILIRFCEQIPDALVILWVMRRILHPVTGTQFGILTVIEMATAVAVYIPVAYFADRTAKKPFVLITFCFFTLFPLVLYFCQSFVPLLAAFFLRGLKEFGEPTRKAMIMDLAPEDAKAGMFGLYYLIRDSIVSLAAFGGALLWMISPEVNLFTAFGFGVLGTIWFAFRGRDLTSGAVHA